jgi:thermopsin
MQPSSTLRATFAVLLVLVTVGSAFSVLGGGLPAGPATPSHRSSGADATPAIPSPQPSSPVPPATLSAAAQRMLSITQRLHASGVPVGAIHLPNLAAESVTQAGPVSPTYSEAPAPMGVADIGIHNVSGVLRGYTMYTPSAKGTINLNNASSVYVDGDGADMFGIQFNTVLDNVSISGNSSYQFWTQNFVSYTPSSGWLVFGDNVWNFSSRSGYFPSSSLYSYGPNGTLADSIVYYASGPSFTIHFPFTLTFYNNASLVNGRTALFFNYTVSNATTSRSGSFDQVVFNSNLTRLGGSAPPANFQVKGQSYDPIGLINDIELDVVGNDDGDTTVFTAVNATLTIASWSSAAGSYVPVPSAFNAGSDTGETSTGLAVFWDGSSSVAQMMPGPSFLTGLWNVSSQSGERHVHLTLTPANAFIFLSPGSAFNSTTAQWVPATTSPVDLYLPNLGTYDLRAELSDFDPVDRIISSPANTTTTLVVSLASDPGLGIYTPLYAWDNAELAAISSSGSGTAANPYVLENFQPTPLNPEFAPWNDYQFPVFSGILLVNTTDWVSIAPPSFEITYPASQQPELQAYGQPATNDLQLLFFDATNVTLAGAPGISGWLSAFVGGFPEGSAIFWNSSDNLVASNTFNDEGSALVFYGGTNNTVWDNWFLPASANATNPGFVYDSGANETALNLSENGDLLYNNAFLTPIDAVTPTQDALSCQVACQPALYVDTWNVSDQPATSWTYVHGMNLTGSIVSTTYQGGNFWWNYGTLSDPYDALPYNDSGLITVGGDYVPLTFATLYTVTFRETGLASGTTWSLTSEGVERSSNSTTLSLQSPDGTYPFTVAPVSGYSVPSPKSFTVVGANLTVSLTFRLDYAVTFTASGLTTGQNWSITASSSVHGVSTGSAAGTSPIVLELDNGSYNYSVGAVAGDTPTAAGGQFVVAGRSLQETVTFVKIITPTYPVTFTESGLSSGTSWSVGLGTQQWSSTNTTLDVDETNGTYDFDILPVAGYTSTPNGTISALVSGAPVSVGVIYTSTGTTTPTYAVTFTEVGLTSGTNWSVNATGLVGFSDSSTLVVNAPNGVYSFRVASHPVVTTETYAASSTVIVLAVDGGSPPAQSIVFTPIGQVEVREFGLPSGTSWSWAITGVNGTAAGSGNATSSLEDGSYGFVVTASGYQAVPGSTTFQVVAFGPTYVNVTFSAIGPTSPSTSTNSSSPSLTLEYVIIAALAVVALVLLVGLIHYRRRANAPPPPPPEPYVTGTATSGTAAVPPVPPPPSPPTP